MNDVTFVFTLLNCAECSEKFAISRTLANMLRQTHDTFYCPKGHEQYFPRKYNRKQKSEAA